MKKIYLFCAAGMSTSALVKKMRDYAETINYECEIVAHSVAEVPTYGPEADVVLLGPQVSYQLKKVQEQLPGKPVECIAMMDYGMMNGKAVLERAIKLMEENA